MAVLSAVAVLESVFSGTHGEEAQIDLSSTVDKSRITIGDLIHYSVTATHGKDVKVEMPGLGANLGGFEIRDYRVQDPEKQNGRIVSRFDYTISTFFTGTFEIPSLSVKYTLPGDTTAKILSTEPIQIVVESVKPSEAGDIRDVKPPRPIPRDWWLLIRWSLLALLIAGAGIFGFWWYRRKKLGKGLIPTKELPVRPPHETAYENLKKLEASDLLARGEVKQFYIKISEIIRQYIEGRYFVVAMEMTTTEVLNGLACADVPVEEIGLFQTFLDRCDLVKFAKHIPSEEQNGEIVRMAYDIVDRTKIIIEEPVEEIPEQLEMKEAVL
jgi:hypothetical protein